MDNLPNLNARQLTAVLAVAENRSFIAAAAQLKISQPALTRTIKHVEAELGVELFARTSRQVAVTAAGTEFIALVERLLSDLRLGVTSLRARTENRRGQVVVSSVLPLADGQLPPLLARYRNEYPGIDLHLREGMHGSVLDDVTGGVADFGITYLNSLPDSLTTEALGIESLHAVLPVRHPLTRKRRIELRELREADFISYPLEARTRRLVDNLAAAARFAPRHALVVNRVGTLMSMVRNGLGVAIVPSSERPLASDRYITSRPLAAAKISRLGIVRLRERELRPAASALLLVLKEWIRAVAPRRLNAARRSS